MKSPDALKRWPVGLLGVFVLAALGYAYWDSYQAQQHYLQSRNFRLLSVLASQVDQLINARARIVRNVVMARQTADPRAEPWLVGAMESANPPLANLSEQRKWLPKARHGVTGEAGVITLHWARPATATLPAQRVTAGLSADVIVKDVFEAKHTQNAFDTLALATPDGQIVYTSGRRIDELKTVSLTALLPATAGAAPPRFEVLAQKAGEVPLELGGTAYRMFVHPCCRGDRATGAAGLVVVGFAPTDAMRRAALAISPVLVLTAVALILASVVGWAFMKVALVGPQQRIMRRDVTVLAASAVFGLALGVILLVTTAAYLRISADVDEQLEILATGVHDRFVTELDAAHVQLSRMTEQAFSGTNNYRLPAAEESCREVLDRTPLTASEASYAGFTAFSLIDAHGMQRFKVARTAAAQQCISVADRPYFTRARAAARQPRADAARTVPPASASCLPTCTLESLWSWTTGEPQVVLAGATGDPKLPVAALSIPMRPLLKPVLPPGFAFAVIDKDGLVLFHSDVQRNVNENLFIETDQNPHLRSTIAAHRAIALNTPYWGRPHRAYVMPARMAGWSVVALYDKQQTRALVLEWTAVTLVLQGAFMVLWLLGSLAATWVGLSWLWPDSLRRPWYGVLMGVCVVGMVAWGAASLRLTPLASAIGAVLVTCALWAIAYVVLSGRPPGVGDVMGWSKTRACYQGAGALLLMVSAVLPALAFVAVSYDMHLASYVKSRQIAMANVIDGHDAATVNRVAARRDPRYEDAFYGTRVGLDAPCPTVPTRDSTAHPWMASLVTRLPYFTSAALETRGFLFEQAQDDAWRSCRPEVTQAQVDVAGASSGARLHLRSSIPSLWGVRTARDQRLVPLALIILALLPVAVAVVAWHLVGYVLRRVLLADIVEPMRNGGRLVAGVGQHVLLVCDAPATRAAAFENVSLLPLMTVLSDGNVRVAWRRALVALGEVSPSRPVAIPDFTDHLDDLPLVLRKLELIEELMIDPEQTVIVLSHVPPHVLAACVRDASAGQPDRERWSAAIGRLIAVDERQVVRAADGDGSTATIAGWRGLKEQLKSSWRRRALSNEAFVDQESRPRKALRPICDELKKTDVFKTGSRDQILEEIEDRAAPLYRREWLACDNDERVVLEHVARHGLASAGSGRVIRRLLGRGLLRKDPQLRVMNRSFQRFVLATDLRREVAALEGLAEQSVWDRIRLPLGVAAVATLLFLMVTQREALDATVALTAGVTTAVPALTRLVMIFASIGGRSATVPKADA
ncbi:MAG: cache domain-containing protein [Acidobacteria bacterium]|nr:cache domain-containing protein [Acidobacteriota bacterium]